MSNLKVVYIRKHEIDLKTSLNEYIQQTSILKAANQNLNNEKSIETAMIVKCSTKINEVNFKNEFKYNEISISDFQKQSFWMIVSSVEKNLSQSPELKNMMPCVAIATEVTNISTNAITFCKLKVNNSKNGLAFCFLPLSIETNLNFHIKS